MVSPHRERSTTRSWWLRARALAVGGLVLSAGTAATLAAWNDSEYASATITASVFQIEGSTTSSTTGYSDHEASASAAALTFSPPVGAMTPSAQTHAGFWVRTKSASTAGTIVVQPPVSTGALAPALTYGIRVVPATGGCTAATFGASTTTIIPPGTALTATTAGTSIPIAAAGATPVQLCFQVTLPSTTANTFQGTSATPTWQLLGTST
ncbi:SipW-dependent-type signal peptide-containing protein [Marisediminicola sp. LYQ134]|uniref:SipW-dependent-type signal peptide-containing protein n=1 Tax=unclassified Marisediminicola TaxID=2618316 RepID=UPI003983918D